MHLCAVRVDDASVRACADSLYEQLNDAHVEVLYDDRSVRAGIMFSDADLLGIPYRIIVSPRNLSEQCVELVSRDKTLQEKVPSEAVVDRIRQLIYEKQ